MTDTQRQEVLRVVQQIESAGYQRGLKTGAAVVEKIAGWMTASEQSASRATIRKWIAAELAELRSKETAAPDSTPYIRQTPDDWLCSECRSINLPIRRTCRICGRPRQSAEEPLL